jgi:hypothetical protein
MQLLNPYPDIRSDHPVLLREMRRLPWLNGASSPVRHGIRAMLRVLFALLVLYGLWLLYQRLRQQDFLWFRNATSDYFIIVGVASLLVGLLLDFLSITTALNSINGEMISGTWDLLRLTAIREGELVLAKHASNQLRVWRATMRVIGLRIGASLIAVITFFGTDFLRTLVTQRELFGESLLFFVFNFIPSLGLFAVFCLEPLWRMRAVTALGMVISARSTDASASAPSAMGALLAFWLAQLIVAVAVVAGFSVLLFSIALFGIGALCAPLLALLVLFSTLYGFYSVLKTWSLRQVARRVASYTH